MTFTCAAEIERDEIIQLVRQWGGSSSDAILGPHCQIFSSPAIQGFIGYRAAAGCAIVYGEPICSPEDRYGLVRAFHEYCKKTGWSIIYVIVSEEFVCWAKKHLECAALEFGEENFIDPHDDPRAKTGTRASLVRRKVRHAQKEGTAAQEYLLPNDALEKAIEQVGEEWLKNRQGTQLYISTIRLFADRLGKRWFYATQGHRVVGVVVLNELKLKQGWLLNHLMIVPDAPHGTPELLVVTALDTLRQEGCRYMTFGAAPGDKLGEITGFGRMSCWLMRKIFAAFHKLLRLDGYNMFWKKFHPQSHRTYLLFGQPRLGWRELLGLSRAFNISHW